mmetsp:Transcript_19592/g.41295  ORF Transcript_19592/g.41295 Transcript_19592/m.41295 type:complete len:682 (+) Transcript_19592:169-2214(+)
MRPALLPLCLLALSLAASSVHARCPYEALWMPDSPAKLPEDHPAMLAYTGGRHLQQQEEGDNEAPASAPSDGFSRESFQKGAGTCEYKNPFTQFDTCVQMTGSNWDAEDQARAYCEGGGIGIPGTVGTFTPGAVCAAFDDANFAGVCVNGEGEADETASAFVEVEGNLLGSCDLTISGCETFGGGKWYAAGGKCSKESLSDDVTTSVVDVPPGTSVADLAEGECKLQAGIAGGGHMDIDAFWSSACANSNSSYSMPRRWTAVTETITTQQENRSRSVGRVWYDVGNNRKREDSYLVEGELNVFQNAKNTTFLHFGPQFYLIDWNEDGNHTCVIANSPVGILRPNWIIDSEGYDALSQYLGTEYMVYEGEYRRVKKFRKTEPLEDAYMIQSFDDQEVWVTPEGEKRRPLNRQTPGAPFQGDAVNAYFNHSTDFSDDVFDVWKTLDCVEREFNRSQFQEIAAENGANLTEGISGLNMNSSFHVDSSVFQQDCEECDIVYEIREVDEESGEADEAEGDASDGSDSEDDAAASAGGEASDFSGSEEADGGKIKVQWSYSAANNTLSLEARLSDDVWFAIAFPEEECLMEPAVSVIALPGDDAVEGNSYTINSHSLSGIRQSNDISEIPRFETSKSAEGDIVISLDKVVTGGFPLSVTWAKGFERKLGYHGGSGRGCLAVAPVDTE